MLALTKPWIDIGIQSNQTQKLTHFWSKTIGLRCEEVLDVYHGVQQHRYRLQGGILKLNLLEDLLPSAPRTGYRKIIVADPAVTEIQENIDPDGTQCQRVPPSTLDGYDLGLEIAVTDSKRFTTFYAELLGLEPLNDGSFACGKTKIFIQQSTDAVSTADDHGPGIRYITLQIRHLDILHSTLLAKGVTEHKPPAQWNEMSYISFIRDPDNNLIELSQRRDLS